jgi:hypothetical protein
MRLRRLLAVPAFAAAMVVAQAAGISPAHASVTDMACNYDFVTFNACLSFQAADQENYLTAHAGLDAFMSQVDAQQDAATPPRAWLYGRVGNTNRFIGELTLVPGWPAAGPGGLGAEWSGTFYRGNLNVTSGDDQLFAVVAYYSQRDGVWVQHNTGVVHGEFAPTSGGGGGGGGCVIVCP